MGLDPGSIRRSYDRVAERYADELIDELGYKPLDRALLAVLAEDVRSRGGGPIADDFRFLESGPIAERLERAGFIVEAVLERAPYPDEADTQRSYLLARRSMP